MNYSKLRFLPVLMVALFVSCKTTGHKTPDPLKASIQNALDSLVVENEIPGMNFSYIDSKGSQHDFSSGYENKEAKQKLQTTHTMFSGSVGKTYAAALVFQLVDEGKIKLDNKILAHLPDDDWLQRIANIENITIRMLLSHTSGLPRWVMKPEVWETLKNEPDKVWSYRERFSYVFDEDAVHDAGEDWAYSDTNYLLLGYLIETILKDDYYDILENSILTPYNLKNTFPSLNRDIERLAMAYSEMPASFHIPNKVIDTSGKYVFNPQMEWTGGGLASTTSDLVKWTDIYYTSDIMSDTCRSEMLYVTEQGKNAFADIHSYGMGSFIYRTKYGKAYGHSGFMPGYNTLIAYFPELKMSFALQVNCDYASRRMPLVGYVERILDVIDN